MTYLVAYVPEVNTLIERLKEEDWIIYYAKFDAYRGDLEGITYLVEFLKKRFANMPESSYY
jgi:hypothetical protein